MTKLIDLSSASLKEFDRIYQVLESVVDTIGDRLQ